MKVDRATLRMSESEVVAYLGERRWARAATVSADAEPHVSPVGYVFLEGRLYFYSARSSPRTRNIAAGSRVALCVDDGVGERDGYRDRRGVVAHGTARLLGEDEPLLERVRPAYSRSLFGDPAVEVRRRTHVWIEVDPYRLTSWDFGRIPAGSDRFS